VRPATRRDAVAARRRGARRLPRADALAGGALGATCDTSWASAASGFWDIAGNWTAGVPDNAKNACITVSGTYTVTVRGYGRSAAGITLGGSSGQQTLKIAGDGTNGGAYLALPNQGSASDGVLANGRVVLTSSNATYYAELNGGSKVLTNNGQISVDAGAGGARYLYGGVNNTATGTVTVNQATDSNQSGQWTNAGTITIAAGAALTDIGPLTTTGTLTIGTGATFSQTGNFSWPSGPITNNGSLTAYAGSFTTGTGSVTGNKVVLLNKALSPNGSGAATLVLHGLGNTLATDIAAGYPLTIEGNAVDGSAVLASSADRTSNAPIHLTSTDPGQYAELSSGSNVLTNNASLIVDAGAGGPRYVYGGVNNTATGKVTVNQTTEGNGIAWTSAGKVTVAGGKTLQLGTVSLTLNGGTLSGNGTVQANVTNVAGNVTPGGSPGKLTISGDYTQQTKGKVTVDIKGASPGQFDVLAVTGAATLTGTLVLKPDPAFTGTVGQQFPVLTAASYSGTFTKLSKAVIDANAGTYYQPTYPGGAPTLVVTQATFSAPASGARGAQITVSGTGWIPGKKVTISLTDSLLVTTILKSVTANVSGSFSTSVTIPTGAETGNGTISAKGAITALTMTRTITIT
jgi:hypothetical protein